MKQLIYNAQILPNITLIGQNLSTIPHKNMRRISQDYIFYIITEGTIKFKEGFTEYTLHKGDCFLFDPKVLHFGTEATHHQFRYIHFNHPEIKTIEISEEKWLPKARGDNKKWLTCLDSSQPISTDIILPKFIHFEDDVFFSNIIAMIDKAIERRNIRLENYNILCACAVQEIFIEIYRQFVFSTLQKANRGAASTYRINEVINYINSNFNKKLTGKIIEKELSYNFDYLNQLFKRHLDTSIFQMLKTVRIEKAKNLIQTTMLSMESIATKVGFKDEAYFSKVFKKHTGFSPIKYRQQANKKQFF